MSAFPISTYIARHANAAARPVPSISGAVARVQALEAAAHRWLIAYSVAILRVSVGAVFLGFGALKFFPGVSPAENLVMSTTDMLTFGLIPGSVALVAVAVLESVVGLCLVSGRAMRAAVYLLAAQLIGIMSPLVLMTGRLFDGPHGAPTLEGQYVLKDVIIVGAVLVLVAALRGRMAAAAQDQPAR